MKSNSLNPGELIEKIRVPVLEGPQEFCKIGPRNAMVISVASFTLLTDHQEKQVKSCLGTVGPVPIRPTDSLEQKMRAKKANAVPVQFE